MKKQALAIAVLSGLLSIPAFAAPEAAPAAAAPARALAGGVPAAPAPARTPAPAPAQENARPSPGHAPANNTAPPRTPPAVAPNSTNLPANRTPHGNDLARAPGSTQPPANSDQAHNRQTENEERNAHNPEGRHHHRFDHDRFRGNYMGGYLPFAWWYNGDNYWSQPYNDFVYNDNQQAADTSDTTAATPAAPVNTGPTPAQDQAKATNDLQGSPSYRQAVADLAKAQAAYDAASAKALEKLKQDPKYKQLVQRRDQAEDKVEAVQAAARIPSPAQVTPAAQKKLDLSSQVTRMEQDAIANDPQAAAAKNKLIDLNAQVQTLKKQAQNAGQQ